MRKLMVATMNPGKVREFAAALIPHGFEIHGLDAIAPFDEVQETGATFEENARLKAEAYSRLTKLPVLADDSGLEVDALGGAPGVLSARYGGPELDDEGRNRAVLAALEGVPEERRGGRFRCVLALAAEGRTLATFEGVVEGRILEAGRGSNGFGYDPIFFYGPADCTFGELPRADKQRYSHRGQAVRAFLRALDGRDARLRCLAS